jgi:DNA-binding protein YbaB
MTSANGRNELRVLRGGDQLESALTRLAEAKVTTDEARNQIAESTYKATPKNKMFTVTVSGRGEFKALSFRGDDYRTLPPAELAEMLVTTFEKARRQSVEKAMEGLNAVAPDREIPIDQLSQATSVEDFMNTLMEATNQALPEDSRLQLDRKDL